MVTIDMRELAGGSPYWANGQLRSVGVNPCYGQGCLSKVKSFQSGISIVMQDFHLYGDGKIRLSRGDTSPPPVIGFLNCFSGVGHISHARPRFFVGSGFSSIEFAEYELSLSMEVACNTPVQTLAVCMDPAVFLKLTGQHSSRLTEALYLLDRRAGKNEPTRSKPIDFAQKTCGYQVFTSFAHHPHETLFLEAKALELVALQLRQIEYLTGKTPQSRVVEHHVVALSHACEILKKEMAHPPKTVELARRVGLNHNQLIQGFKEMLGLRPFDYLRIIRLEKARDLIASHTCNVSEAAYTVGYSSLSHFTKTFREEFGINPKAFAYESGVTKPRG